MFLIESGSYRCFTFYACLYTLPKFFLSDDSVTPVWGDFMFSVRFRRVRVRRRNNFCLLCENPLSYTSHIRHKEYMDLAKCTGWPFNDLDPRSWLRDKMRTIHRITTKRESCIALVMVIIWVDFDEVLLKNVNLQIFVKNFRCVFSRSNTILAISQEWLVWLIWNEREVHPSHTG